VQLDDDAPLAPPSDKREEQVGLGRVAAIVRRWRLLDKDVDDVTVLSSSPLFSIGRFLDRVFLKQKRIYTGNI